MKMRQKGYRHMGRNFLTVSKLEFGQLKAEYP